MSKGKTAAGLSAAILLIAAPFVSKFEGTRLEPYRDLNGIWTVCRGETHVEMRPYTKAECDDMFKRSLEAHGHDVMRCLPDGLPPNVYAAAWSIGYNMGAPKFCGSEFAQRLRAGDGAGACKAISLLTTINDGKVDCADPRNRCGGIVRRRAGERAICEGRAS